MRKDGKIIIVSGIILFVIAGTVIIVSSFRRNKIKCGAGARLLFVGDSNTAATSGYVEKITSLCPSNVKKISLSGASTSWMYDQLKKELAANKYDAIFVMGGSNDIYGENQIDKAESNLQAMYDLIKKSGAISIAITPPNKNYFPNKTPQKQQMLFNLVNFIMRSRADHKINLWSLTNSPNLFISDMQHLNAQGHAVLANAILNKIS